MHVTKLFLIVGKDPITAPIRAKPDNKTKQNIFPMMRYWWPTEDWNSKAKAVKVRQVSIRMAKQAMPSPRWMQSKKATLTPLAVTAWLDGDLSWLTRGTVVAGSWALELALPPSGSGRVLSSARILILQISRPYSSKSTALSSVGANSISTLFLGFFDGPDSCESLAIATGNLGLKSRGESVSLIVESALKLLRCETLPDHTSKLCNDSLRLRDLGWSPVPPSLLSDSRRFESDLESNILINFNLPDPENRLMLLSLANFFPFSCVLGFFLVCWPVEVLMLLILLLAKSISCSSFRCSSPIVLDLLELAEVFSWPTSIPLMNSPSLTDKCVKLLLNLLPLCLTYCWLRYWISESSLLPPPTFFL